jgi:hypothetical protein
MKGIFRSEKKINKTHTNTPKIYVNTEASDVAILRAGSNHVHLNTLQM